MGIIERNMIAGGHTLHARGHSASGTHLSGPQPTLILLHGFTGAASVWDEYAAAWSATRDVWALDLPGHGQSRAKDTSAYKYHEQAAAIAGACVELAAGKPFVLLGYSMGGRLALGASFKFPAGQAGLVLESTHPGLATDAARNERRKSDAFWSQRFERHPIEQMAAEWEAQPLLAPLTEAGRRHAKQLQAVRRSQNGASLAAALTGAGLAEQGDYMNRMADLNIPILLITGSQDTKFEGYAVNIAQRCSRVRSINVPGAGHTVHGDQPEAYIGAVHDFCGQFEFIPSTI